MSTGPQIAICSADPGLRRWWREAIGEDFSVLEVVDLARIKPVIMNRRPSVLLLDLSLPGLGGNKGLAALARLSPSTNIVALSDDPDQSQAVDALKAGAHGYSPRQIDTNLARKTIETVQKGELWVKRGVMLALLRELIPLHQRSTAVTSPGADSRLRPLTSREREIAYLVAAGARNKDIAASLSITETTVKAHLTAIFRKLGVPDRLRLALMLTEHESAGQRRGRGAAKGSRN